MTRFGSIAMIAGVGLALAVTACGSSSQPTGPTQSFHWWPSTPLAAPVDLGQSQPSATSAPSAAVPTVGEGQSNGLGTPAETVAATANLQFSPNTTNAKIGDVIQWTNTGSVPHNVTFDGNGSLTSSTLGQGDTWQVKFSVAGTYKYRCTFHPGMDGQVTVGG